MKIFLIVLLATVLSCALLFAAELDTQNAVVSVQISSLGGTLSLVSVPGFPTSTTNTSFTLDELLGTNLTANWSWQDADEVYLWTGTNYAAAFLNDATWGSNSFKWCYMGGGNPQLCSNSPWFDLSLGEGFWINNKNSDVDLVLAGEVPMAPTSMTAMAGLMLLANPYPAAMEINALISTSDGSYANWSWQDADEIYFWDGLKYTSYFMNDATWGSNAWIWCYMSNGNPQVASATLQPGQGFWYNSKGTNFNWFEPKPYAYP